MDFTLDKYKQLLLSLKKAGYSFLTMEQLLTEHQSADDNRIVCLRHDVDLKADHSLRTAELEHELGVRAVYYFRVVPQSNQPDIIRKIAELGHEIGYHYEDMSICDGDVRAAYEHFCTNLAYFRTFYPVKTICMHGAPTSRYDGRDLWKSYDYKALGLVCEPYLDLDYSRLFYLTDTGRRWDGYKVSVRDKIPVYQDEWTRQGLVFHATDNLINAISDPFSSLNMHHHAILITTHPQRWTNSFWEGMQEYLLQSMKNIVKRVLVSHKNK